MTVRVSVAVQHHPSRAELLPELLGALAGLETEVVTDPDPTGQPSPWRTYRECLVRTPGWATHRLIIQDDVVPCRGFAAAAQAAVEACGHRPIAFWVGGFPQDLCAVMRRAAQTGCPWVDFVPWHVFPCVAAVWPVKLAVRLLEWADEKPGRVTRADDGVTARFLQAERVWPLATVPSLVEHPNVVPSVIGRAARGPLEKSRVACVPLGDRDPSTITW